MSILETVRKACRLLIQHVLPKCLLSDRYCFVQGIHKVTPDSQVREEGITIDSTKPPTPAPQSEACLVDSQNTYRSSTTPLNSSYDKKII